MRLLYLTLVCADAQLVTRSHAWEPSIRDSYAKMRVDRSRHKSIVGKSSGMAPHAVTAESEGEADAAHERLLDEGTAAWLVRSALYFIHSNFSFVTSF